MNELQVRPVRTRRERRTFLTFPWRIYGDDPLWVPPLLSERAKTIDPKRGAFFQRGEAEFYIAWQSGRPVGTICAAEDREINEMQGKRECTFGFFESVNDLNVARALLDRAVGWAEARGLDALVGPLNLDRENSYGVLIEGRDRPPVLFCGHTPPYYQDLLERSGALPARADNLAFAIEVAEDTPALRRLSRLAQRLRERGSIVIREADLEHWDEEIDRVHRLLIESLAHLPDFVPWHRGELQATLEPFRDIVDPELVLFAEADGQAIGWFPGIPNLNEALQRANGLRYPWDYARLLWHMRRQPACLAVKSVAVLPDYWDTGAAVLLFDEMAKRARAKGFKWVDLSLTAEDNPYTPALATRLGAVLYKRYRVYRLPIAQGENEAI
ncbi:MAG: GNAT family N-acetyltransferase [Anaerolineae bacterium]|nr:GNAT family N-acetyltransferase [Anaerolineae bacterium]